MIISWLLPSSFNGSDNKVVKQFATGYTVAYLVYTIGTLITDPASLQIVPALIGLAIVAAIALVIAGMIRKTNQNMAAEYALRGK